MMNMVCYLLNRSPRASLDEKVAMKVSTDFNNLRIFRCPTFVRISNDERYKLDPKSKKLYFCRLF